MNKRYLSAIGLGLGVILFFLINIVFNIGCRAARVDLTEDKVFTLDEGSKSIAKGIDEPINLYFYFSRSVAREYPPVMEYADRVLGMLREYERASGGNIRLKVVEPEAFSEEEDQAVEQGIQGAPLPNGDMLYFGLAGTSSTDAKESIPFFALDEDKQRTLEYDLSKLIWTLAHPDKKRLGILTALPMEGGGGNPMMGQQGAPRWQILDQLEDFFKVTVLSPTVTELKDIDILLVAHPRDFTDATLYLIDQWALAGKPTIVFVDPQCDNDPGASDDPTNPMSRYTAKKSSDMEKLFKGWGFELVKNKVACDKELGLRRTVRNRDGRGQADTTVVFFMKLGEKEASRDDPITRLINNVLVMTPGALKKLPDATTTFTPILQTTETSQEVDSSQFQFMPDPQQLFASFVPGYERLTLGARVTGEVKTAFPDGKPGSAKPDESKAEGDTAEKSAGGGLTASTAPLNLVVYSDADLLADSMWMQELGRIGQTVLVRPISENVDLVKNSIESASGGKELMGIRMRGKTSRPFERVQEIQRDADQRFLARQQELERKLQDAERRLNELQKAKPDGSEELVTTEQRNEEAKVREEFVQTRRDLRDVKHQLGKDIAGLGTSLKWINIALMPALVCAAAVALGAMRSQQRSRK